MESQGARGAQTAPEGTTLATRAPVFGHDAFSGTYRTRMEASGRLVLPAAFKSAFEGAAILRARRDEHLLLWTPRAFDVVADALSRNTEGVLDPHTRQRVYMSAPKVSVDRQSRLSVPPELRERVGIIGDAEVVLAGAIESIEIWPAERFDAQEAPKLDDVDLLFDTHPGLPTDPV